MKLVQLNIWQGRLLRQLLNFLRDEQPDLMCLQEIYSSEIDTPAYDFLNGLEKIQAIFPDYHTYFAPTYDMPMLGTKFRFGNAIISRYPLTETETFFINAQYHSYKSLAEYKPNDVSLQRRNLQRATVRLDNGKTFCLINHHGYWDPAQMGVGSDASARRMEKVAAIIKTSPRPVVFAGDLNVVPKSPTMRPIQSLLRNLTQAYKLPTTLSSLGKVPDVPCDHICVSDDIEVQSFAASDALVSDHKALIMEFDVAI